MTFRNKLLPIAVLVYLSLFAGYLLHSLDIVTINFRQVPIELPPKDREAFSNPLPFTVAFLGDQGLGENPKKVLRLILDEGAELAVLLGDFDYQNDPDSWERQHNEILGEDFPYLAVIGNHDVALWNRYRIYINARTSLSEDIECWGELGIRALCTYKGIDLVFVAAGITAEDHANVVRQYLTNSPASIRICVWHKNQRMMQVGAKFDQTGWPVYEECLKNGAFVATGHEHSYQRTHLMNNFEKQEVASRSDVLDLKKGSSFAVVSGLGGHSIRPQLLFGEHWASVYTATQNADFGALFCTFNTSERPATADCYFKSISGDIPDEFKIIGL